MSCRRGWREWSGRWSQQRMKQRVDVMDDERPKLENVSIDLAVSLDLTSVVPWRARSPLFTRNDLPSTD